MTRSARRLTEGAAIDAHPTWTPDGSAIVFASTREGADFDLWRLPMRDGRAAGAAIALTSAAGHEVTPAMASDGTIVYTAVSTDRDAVTSHLEQRAPEGTITRLTDGPADSAPAISPDGSQLAFARPAIEDSGRTNVELWLLPHGAREPIAVTALPLTDEGGPVWSRDGRFLFATSILRGETGVLFSSVIHVDLRESGRRARMLVDRAGAVARLTPAIAMYSLDASTLRQHPEYVSELARIMARAIEQRSETPPAPEGTRR